MRALFLSVILVVASSAARAGEISLGLPIACSLGRDCWVQQYPDDDPGPAAQDYACGTQSYDGHDGLDIRLRDAGSSADVVAAAAGIVKAKRDGVADHLLRTPADRLAIAGRECGNGVVIAHGGGWETQYCHLRQGSVTVRAGEAVTAGQKLGSVGFSGDAAFPHVHLTARKNGVAVDPFRPNAAGCGGADAPLWNDQAMGQLAYLAGSFLRTGFAAGPVKLESLEDGTEPDGAPVANWPALVAFGWAINLEAQDTIRVTLAGPQGIAAANETTLGRAKAQYLLFAGKKRPAGGWPSGLYKGRVEVLRGGTVRISSDWDITLP